MGYADGSRKRFKAGEGEEIVWVSDDGEVVVRTTEEELERFVIPLERVPEYRKLVERAARAPEIEGD